MDDFVNQIAVQVQHSLVGALLFLLAAVVIDLIFGVLVAGIINKNFSLRRLADFWVTTTGYQKLVAFAAAVVVMLVHGDAITRSVVTAMAVFYALAIIPDIYDKISTLIFRGQLPLSTSVATPAPPTPTP